MSKPILTNICLVGDLKTASSCSKLWASGVTYVSQVSSTGYENASLFKLNGAGICGSSNNPSGTPLVGSIWMRSSANDPADGTLSIFKDGSWKTIMFDNGGSPPPPPPQNGWDGTYYWINDVQTTLDSDGTGIWAVENGGDNKYYYQGSLGTGNYQSDYYYMGELATGLFDVDGNGVLYYYDNGNLGNGLYMGTFYNNGLPGNGWDPTTATYYITNSATTLANDGNGAWSGHTYGAGAQTGYTGVLNEYTGGNSSACYYFVDGNQTTINPDTCSGWDETLCSYYIAGSPSTLNSSGNGAWSCLPYVDGVDSSMTAANGWYATYACNQPTGGKYRYSNMWIDELDQSGYGFSICDGSGYYLDGVKYPDINAYGFGMRSYTCGQITINRLVYCDGSTAVTGYYDAMGQCVTTPECISQCAGTALYQCSQINSGYYVNGIHVSGIDTGAGANCGYNFIANDGLGLMACSYDLPPYVYNMGTGVNKLADNVPVYIRNGVISSTVETDINNQTGQVKVWTGSGAPINSTNGLSLFWECQSPDYDEYGQLTGTCHTETNNVLAIPGGNGTNSTDGAYNSNTLLCGSTDAYNTGIYPVVTACACVKSNGSVITTNINIH